MWHIADVSADHHCNPTDGLQRHSVVITAVTDPGALHRQARPHSPHRTAPHRTAPHRTAPHRTAPTSLSVSRKHPYDPPCCAWLPNPLRPQTESKRPASAAISLYVGLSIPHTFSRFTRQPLRRFGVVGHTCADTSSPEHPRCDNCCTDDQDGDYCDRHAEDGTSQSARRITSGPHRSDRRALATVRPEQERHFFGRRGARKRASQGRRRRSHRHRRILSKSERCWTPSL
jgi:hypothetical protein